LLTQGSNQPTTSSSASSSSSTASQSSNRHTHLTLENLKKSTCNNKSINELEILETSSSTSNSNKENFTTTREEVSSKKSKKSSPTATHSSPSLKSQSKRSETISKNNTTTTTNNINNNNTSSSNSSGKSLTNKIKNKYKNISKKENRLQIQNRSQKINTSSSSSSSSTPSSILINTNSSSPSSSSSTSTSSSTIIINQINSNIASLKKPTSLLNLSMIRDELMTAPVAQELQPNETRTSNVSTSNISATNRDKKLRNSTNLSLRTTRLQKQPQPQPQQQQQQPQTPKVILTHVTSPKGETLTTPLKRLNVQNGSDYMLKTPIDPDGVNIMSKRRKLTETNLLKNQSSNSSSLAQVEMIEEGVLTSQSTTASTNVSMTVVTPPSESRTRFSLRINNTSK
jgi:trimeric autotransporter adhesin